MPHDPVALFLGALALLFVVLYLRSRRFIESEPAFAVLFAAYMWDRYLPRRRLAGLLVRAPLLVRLACLVAVGAFLGPRPFLSALLVIALVGGVLGLFEAGRRGVLAAVLRRTGRRLLALISPGRAGFEPVAATPEGFTVPYGLAIGVGALITWFLGVSLP